MRRFMTGLGMTVYVLACAALFLLWAPRFFYLNVELKPEFTLEYATVSGLVFAVFLLSVIVVQAVTRIFSGFLVLQIAIVGISFWFALFAFDFPPQAELFSFIHIVAAVLFLVINLNNYRKRVSGE